MIMRVMIINRVNLLIVFLMMYGVFDVNFENDLRCKLLLILYIIYI